ncbi:hypothetical protein ADIS_3469 [Lunatimonas lonarensis]|uniref:Uncharacterized protein n=1 Tax=Lunatimonas lonarensis TaxID=1232681 RepID=R7ZQD5_9BACT|nr:hypothetical protein ADIS_3469 [Lunatimonas lonarensis]
MLLGCYRPAVCQSVYDLEFITRSTASIFTGEGKDFSPQAEAYAISPGAQSEEGFMAVPQWFNLGYGTGGFYISYWNTHLKALFKPLTEAGNSSGLYIGLYNTLRGLDEKDLAGDFGVRGTFFLNNLEDKFNVYGKGELALVNFGDDDLRYFLPRVGIGVRWRFLYAEAGTGPNPLHAGICWQWSSKKNR